MTFPVAPPVSPMLAKLARELPVNTGKTVPDSCSNRSGTAFVPSSSATATRSRSAAATRSPLTRYFPELPDALRANLPTRCVVDGEIVIATRAGPRLRSAVAAHPSGRVARGDARRGDARLVRRLRPARRGGRRPPDKRRSASDARVSSAPWRRSAPPVLLTPATADRALAEEWFERFEGAGLDGVVAKPLDGALRRGQAHDAQGEAPAHRRLRRRRLPRAQERGRGLAAPGPLRRRRRAAPRRRRQQLRRAGAQELAGVPRAATATARSTATRGTTGPRPTPSRPRAVSDVPGAQSRWTGGKDLSWEPVRIELVAEVAYEHLQGDRFRHTARVRALAPRSRTRIVHLRAARRARCRCELR